MKEKKHGYVFEKCYVYQQVRLDQQNGNTIDCRSLRQVSLQLWEVSSKGKKDAGLFSFVLSAFFFFSVFM